MNKRSRIRWLEFSSDNRKFKSGPADENRKWLGLSVIAFVFVVCGAVAQAQQPTKIPRIAYLSPGSPSAIAPRIEAFRQGLRELEYVEGKNIVIEWRSAEGKFDRLPALAAELVRLKVVVIVTGGSASTRAAKETTVTIPIVMAQDADPVRTGFVASLARPGGNITGLSTFAPELSGKRLEILKEVVPRLSRVAVFGTSTLPGYAQVLKELELAAGALKVMLQYLDVLDPKDIGTAFQAASKGRADGILLLNSAILNSQRKQVVDLAAKSRLPAIYDRREYVEEAGGLMTYGVNFNDLNRRAATFVCGQDFERHEARRPSRGAADEVRVHHQSEGGEADRSDDSAECAGESQQSDPMIWGGKKG